MPFLEGCVIFGGMCHFLRNVSFVEECAIFGGICHFWRNVPFLEKCAIFGGMCYFWMGNYQNRRKALEHTLKNNGL